MHAGDLLRSFGLEYLLEQRILPIEQADGTTKILVSPLTDPLAIHNLSVLMGHAIVCENASTEQIERELRLMMEDQYGTPSEVIEREEETPDAIGQSVEKSHEDLLLYGADSLTVKLVNSLLMEALRYSATDVHFQPVEDGMLVRYRIDGMLRDMHRIEKKLVPSICARIKVMSKLDLTQRRIPQDGRASISSAAKNVELRVSVVPTSWGERIVLRILDKDNLFFPSHRLGLMPDQLACLKGLVEKSSGMILVTGPTGCGKTTTLYSFISEMNCSARNVMTIEDPVEYSLPEISQMQIKPKLGLDFSQGLRSLLRQDPDVILLGEIRDHQTARIAIRAALTGHLVLSTLHTNDAIGALTRLLDLDIEPFFIVDALIGVVSQRLIRKTCPTCKEIGGVSDDSIASSTSELSSGKDCEGCFGSGYRGRTGIFELFTLKSQKTRRVILKSYEEERIRETLLEEGFTTLRDVAQEKLKEGQTDIKELQRVLG